MSFIDEIRKTQAETISNYEEKLRRDSSVVAMVVHAIHEGIKAQVSDYNWAKETTDMTFKFVQKTLLNVDKYIFTANTMDDKQDIEITRPEYDTVIQMLLKEGFKISQRDGEEEYYRDGQCPGFSRSIRMVRKLTVEW